MLTNDQEPFVGNVLLFRFVRVVISNSADKSMYVGKFHCNDDGYSELGYLDIDTCNENCDGNNSSSNSTSSFSDCKDLLLKASNQYVEKPIIEHMRCSIT